MARIILRISAAPIPHLEPAVLCFVATFLGAQEGNPLLLVQFPV